MTRRDAGIILWAAAGFYALVSACSLVAVYGSWIWTFHDSVMGGWEQRIYKGVFDLALACLALAAMALLRQRAALSAWLFHEAPRLPAAADAAEPGVAAAEGIAALDACALAVVAVAIRLIAVCIGSVGNWAYLSLWVLTHPQSLLRRGTAGGLAPLITLVAGLLLIARRNSVAAWVLRDGTVGLPPASRFDVQRIGLRLFGLMLFFGYLPDLVTEVASAYDHALNDPISHGLPARLWRPLLPPLLSVLLGVGLALGEDGLRLAWRRLRSLPPEDEQLEDDVDSSGGGPPDAG